MAPGGLVARDIAIRYRGNVAVDGVTVAAEVGKLTGLIGPNGAGKTSLFNACSGLRRPDRGTIELFGRDVSRLSPARRARLGLGRTFQRTELVRSMTVTENIALGREAHIAGWNPHRHFLPSPHDRAAVRAAVDDAVELCGLGEVAHRPVAELPTGQLRLIELARAYATGFRLLLLDEPSSGLDPAESEALGRIVRQLVTVQGMGVLLVEHDMALVMSVCEHIYVLDFGVLIFEGSPEEVRASAKVRTAYLGVGSGLTAETVAVGAVPC